MSTRIHIDRLQLSGIDERTARAALALLPDMLSSLLRNRPLASLKHHALLVTLRGSGPRDIARAVAEALLKGQP